MPLDKGQGREEEDNKTENNMKIKMQNITQKHKNPTRKQKNEQRVYKKRFPPPVGITARGPQANSWHSAALGGPGAN